MANSAVVGTLRAILTANSAEFETAMKRASGALREFSKDTKQIGQQASQLGMSLTKILTVPILAAGGAVSKFAVDFESSFAGVRKTVNATEPEFAVLAQTFRDLAKTIPIDVNELNRLGEAAGALGIPKQQLADFARVMALVGVTTNVTSEQAAESIAKVQNIFGAAGKDTERFASTLVALGNDGASTEAQILSMSERIAGAGNAIGMSQGQVLAFASALSSVGIEAEMGGSAISTVFIDMAKAVNKGGEAVAGFAKVANKPIKEFTELFKKDAATAVNEFVLGLSRIKESGGNLLGTLEALGFSEKRVRDTLLRAAGAGDLLTRALNVQADAWQKNTALSEEARKRFETTASQLTLLWNRVKDVGITLGNTLLPMIKATVGVVGDLIPVLETLAGWFGKLPVSVQALSVALLGLVAAAGPAIYFLGQLSIAAAALTGLGAGGGAAGAARAVGGLTAALGLLGSAVAVVTTAFGAWKLGTWFGEVSGIAFRVEMLAGALMGLSEAERMAGRNARLAAQERIQALQDFEDARARLGIKKGDGKDIELEPAAGPKPPLVPGLTGGDEDGTKAGKKRWAEVMAELASVGADYRAILDGINGETVEAIRFYLEAGVAQGVLADAYGLTAVQIKAVAEALKAEADALKAEGEAWDFRQQRQAGQMGDAVSAMQQGAGGNAAAFVQQLRLQKIFREQNTGQRLLESTPFKPFGPNGLNSIVPGVGMEQAKNAQWAEISGKTAGQKFSTALKGSLGNLNGIFQAAFEGGGGVKGAIQSFATQAISGVLGAIPLIGPMLSQFGGAIVAGFKKLFGGPSQQELEGRDIKAKFQESFGSFENMLGAINDAYLATGRTSEQARKDVERLMAAEKEGADAVKKVMAEINKAFEEQKTRWEGVQESVADLNAFVKDGVGELGRYNIASQSAVAIFDAWVKKTGDVVGALNQIGPALDALDFRTQMEKAEATLQDILKKNPRASIDNQGNVTGLTKAELEQWKEADRAFKEARENLANLGEVGGAAIEQLLGLRRVTEANKPLMEQIGQSTRLLTSLGKAGLLTKDLLISFGQNAVNQFTILKSKTGDARTAMVLMQPELQALWEHQQKFGEFADEATEALINQATEAGLVGPDMKSDQQQLLDVMKEIRDTLREIAGIEIDDKTFKVTPEIEPIDIPDIPTRGPEEAPDFAAMGGRVTPLGIQRLSGGGFVQGLRAQYLAVGGMASMQTLYPSRGTDTVHAMLTPGEEVVTAPGQGLVKSALAALSSAKSAAILEELRSINDNLSRTRQMILQIDNKQIAKATVKAWEDGDASLTQAREVLGV